MWCLLVYLHLLVLTCVYIHIRCFIAVMTISEPLNFGNDVFEKQWYYDENMKWRTYLDLFKSTNNCWETESVILLPFPSQ